MHSRDGQAISSVLERKEERGGRREEGGMCMRVFFFPSASQLSKITQAEFALQKPLPRQLESEQLKRQHSLRGKITHCLCA